MCGGLGGMVRRVRKRLQLSVSEKKLKNDDGKRTAVKDTYAYSVTRTLPSRCKRKRWNTNPCS